MSVYVIGPVTGIEDDNRPAFEQARKQLFAAGHWGVSIPHDVVPKGASWPVAMRHSLARLTATGQCGLAVSIERVAMLPGWEGSKGARLEHQVAVELGIPCKTVDEWVEQADHA